MSHEVCRNRWRTRTVTTIPIIFKAGALLLKKSMLSTLGHKRGRKLLVSGIACSSQMPEARASKEVQENKEYSSGTTRAQISGKPENIGMTVGIAV